MPLIRFPTPKGLVYTIDLSKLADRELPSGSTQTVEEYRRTVEAPIAGMIVEPTVIDWGDGSPPQVVSSGTYPEHIYQDGTGDAFTVTLRSATGHLPRIQFNGGDSQTVAPTKNMSYALISVDHFSGETGNATRTAGYVLRNCQNVKYIDTRIAGSPYYNAFTAAFCVYAVAGDSALDQDIASFCFDFCAYATSITAAFFRSRIRGTMPDKMFDNMTLLTNVSSAFQHCTGLTKPYEFWNASYAANITSAASCYAGCSGMDLAQVPTAYGGTMTVS